MAGLAGGVWFTGGVGGALLTGGDGRAGCGGSVGFGISGGAGGGAAFERGGAHRGGFDRVSRRRAAGGGAFRGADSSGVQAASISSRGDFRHVGGGARDDRAAFGSCSGGHPARRGDAGTRRAAAYLGACVRRGAVSFGAVGDCRLRRAGIFLPSGLEPAVHTAGAVCAVGVAGAGWERICADSLW